MGGGITIRASRRLCGYCGGGGGEGEGEKRVEYRGI